MAVLMQRNIGIVTSWMERGAAYVSRQFKEVLEKNHNIYIYARGGEEYAINNPEWDRKNVHWGKSCFTPLAVTMINKKDFISWLISNQIEIVIFNEQKWWPPIVWCNEIGVKTVAYIDYYKKDTLPLFDSYNYLICNTKRHFTAFEEHSGAKYIPWGTNTSLFKPNQTEFERPVNERLVTFFHSAGMSPYRKGTDIILKAAEKIDKNFKLVIHTQVDLSKWFPKLQKNIESLLQKKILEIHKGTVAAPGLYHLGDIYLYPSRLDGIGLTLAEAESCGLIPVTSEMPPMSEFVTGKSGKLIRIKKVYSREDGYYWPECEPDEEHLSEIMTFYINNPETVSSEKKEARKDALENLDWDKNASGLLNIIDQIPTSKAAPLNNEILDSLKKYENKGIRKHNRWYLKYYGILNVVYRLFFKQNTV